MPWSGRGGSLRRPSLRGTVALAAIVLAGAPIAGAAIGGGGGGGAQAAKAVPHVGYAYSVQRANHVKTAGNTNRVNGFRATPTVTPNTLLPLDAHGHFPASVVPPVNIGPQGPRGPTGRPGDSGNFSSVVVPDLANAAQVQACQGTSAGAGASGGTATAVCGCPVDKPIVGGGFKDISAQQLPSGQRTLNNGRDIVLANGPILQSNGTTAWRAQILNVPSGTAGLVVVEAYAICGTL